MKTETWKDVPGYEGLYQVSNLARIRSLDRLVKHHHDRTILRKGCVLKMRISNGYYITCLTKDNRSTQFRVHRLIMLAFVGKSHLSVDHINGDKTDNRLENLRYCTISENIRYYAQNVRTGKLRRKPKKLIQKPNGLFVGVRLTREGITSELTINFTVYSLGYFKTVENAATAYQVAYNSWHLYGKLPDTRKSDMQIKSTNEYAA